MYERLVTGAERAHCQICQAGEVLVASLTEASDLIMAEESVKSDIQRAMGKSVISETGSVRVHCLLLLSQSVLHVRVAVPEQTMALEETGSEIVNHHLLLGARVVLRARKTVRDPQDENFKNGQLSSGLLLLRSKITNGVPRCDQTPLPPSRLCHLVRVVKHLHPQLLLELCPLADPS
jgi:hypothetical protein